MNRRLDQLLSKVKQSKEAQKQNYEELSQKIEKMLSDVWELSKYMAETFAHQAVPMPVKLENGAHFCIYPTGECKSLRQGAAAYYLHEWDPEAINYHDFALSPRVAYSYFATKELLLDLKSTSIGHDEEHLGFIKDALHELSLHWEDKYKQRTEELVANLMEEWLQENENKPQGLTM